MAEVTTIQSRCRLAADFVRRYSTSPTKFWIAIGKTSAWPDDNSPPYPPPSVNQIPELLGFWYVHTCALIYSNSSGEVITNSGRFSIVDYQTSLSALASAKAISVFSEALVLRSDVIPGTSYRIRALCSDVSFFPTLAPANLTVGTFVPPTSVSSYFVERLSVTKPVIFSGTSDHVIQMIRQF